VNNEVQLSVVIPAFCEEDNLRIILPELKIILENLQIKYEILVIGPREALDNSEIACNKIGATYLRRDRGNSFGDAVRTGIKRAEGQYVIFMDADGSHTPDFINNLYKKRKEYDVVIASRYVKGGKSENSKALVFMSSMVNLLYSIALSLNCKDVSNSFKLYQKSSLKNLKLVSSNFDIVEEILYKLKKANNDLKICEIPYFFKNRIAGRSKRNLPLFALSYLFTLIRLRVMK